MSTIKRRIYRYRSFLELQLRDNKDTSSVESEIDQMVYKLYGLMEEVIKIIEYSVH